MKTAALIIAALALTHSGCATKSITLPGGPKYESRSLFTNPTVGAIKVKLADGTEFSIEGYNHEQTQVAGRALDLAAGLLGK